MRPPSPQEKLARQFVEGALAKRYEKVLSAYIARERAADDTTKKAEYHASAKKSFEEASTRAMVRTLEGTAEDQRKAYVRGLEDYLDSAEKAGLETVSYNQTPMGDFASSPLWSVYHREFDRELTRIKSKAKDGSDMMGLAAKAGIYAALFMLIFCFLLLGVLFSIMRIEKKMQPGR